MANINLVMPILNRLEYGNVKKALHKNRHESLMTYKGIYRYAHPNWVGWNFVDDALVQCDNDYGKTSLYLEQGEYLQKAVALFYKQEFWDAAKLDSVISQGIANEIFIFGVNTGMVNAIRKTQKLIGAEVDGMVGPGTINLLNAQDEDVFDLEFDEVEKQYYADLIKKKPYLLHYKNGWNNRADAV